MLGAFLKQLLRRNVPPPLRCPLCNGAASEFLPLNPGFLEAWEHFGFPYVGREETLNYSNYRCPHCGCCDRERLAWLFIEPELSGIGANASFGVLHVAPEPALWARMRSEPGVEVVTFDLQRDDVDVRGDLCNLNAFGDGVFHGIVCNHVLEHVADDRAAIAEMFRVLAPGGWGVMMVPLYPKDVLQTLEDPTKISEAERWRHFGQDDHVRIFAKADYVARLAAPGFSVAQLGVEHFGAETFRRCAITDQSVLYVVRKP